MSPNRLFVAFAAAALLAQCDAPERASSVAVDVADAIAPGPDGLDAYLDCLSDEHVALIAAHRGGPAPGFPENAIETFAHTLAHGPMIIEADVAATSDGVLVLMHDDALDRTTTCADFVEDQTWAELSSCRLVDDDDQITPFSIPTLIGALEWANGRTVLELDIKSSVRFEDLVADVRAARAEERVILITYSAGAAARLARLAPEMTISADVPDAAALDDLENRGVDLDRIVAWTGTDAEPADPDVVLALEARDVPVIVGTLGPIDAEIARTGEESRYRVIASTGADIIATDRPIEAYDALSGSDDPKPALSSCRGAS